MLNVPKLRFGEFEGEWEKKKLNQIIDFRSGYAFKSSAMSRHIEKYQLIKMSNVYKNILALDRNPSYWKKLEKPQYEYLLEIDDIVLTLTGTIGKKDYGYSVRISENNKFLLNQRLVRLRAIDKISNAKFIHNLILNERFLFYFFKNSKGGTGNQSNVSVDDLKQMKLNLPQLNEQEKIANFLTSIDKKTEQLIQKKILLESYKKGAIQKIFSQEIRFKRDDGGEFEDWEEEKLENYLIESRIKGSSGDKAKKLTVKLWGQGVYEKNEIREGSSNTQYYIRKEGQFIYSKLDFLNCAFALIPQELDGYESTVDLPCFDFIKDVNKELLLERIKQKNFYKKNGDIADGSRKAKRIHADTFLSYKLFFPCLEEQQKIAIYLTSIDQKITQTTQQIEAMKSFKKGLLQQMFV